MRRSRRLMLDLEERGLLNRTLIVIASEFGRDMMVEGKPGKRVKEQISIKQPDIMTEPKHYGMHRHFTEAGCVLHVRRRVQERACSTARPRMNGPARCWRTRSPSKICTPPSTARWAFHPTWLIQSRSGLSM